MPVFAVEVDDDNGRQGLLAIGGKRILTPAYVPEDDIIPAMGGGSGIGEHIVWLQKADIERLRLHPEEKHGIVEAAREHMGRMGSSAKLMHFNFFSDVTGLRREEYRELLCLQQSAGADVIEIPRVFCDPQRYGRVVQAALEWKERSGCETPLMGIARTVYDLAVLERYLPRLGGIGIDCRRYDKPLLYRVRKTLKRRDIWVHAFSAPLPHREVNYQGSLGVLINWFGVDTVNTADLNDYSRQYFSSSISRMGDRERAQFVKKTRYFAPSDYSAFSFGQLEECYGGGYRLSNFCDCPVCRDLTVRDAVEKLPDFSRSNRLHHAFACCSESGKYREALLGNETAQYLEGKPFAAGIIRRSAGHSPVSGGGAGREVQFSPGERGAWHGLRQGCLAGER